MMMTGRAEPDGGVHLRKIEPERTVTGDQESMASWAAGSGPRAQSEKPTPSPASAPRRSQCIGLRAGILQRPQCTKSPPSQHRVASWGSRFRSSMVRCSGCIGADGSAAIDCNSCSQDSFAPVKSAIQEERSGDGRLPKRVEQIFERQFDVGGDADFEAAIESQLLLG